MQSFDNLLVILNSNVFLYKRFYYLSFLILKMVCLIKMNNKLSLVIRSPNKDVHDYYFIGEAIPLTSRCTPFGCVSPSLLHPNIVIFSTPYLHCKHIQVNVYNCLSFNVNNITCPFEFNKNTFRNKFPVNKTLIF